MKITLTFKTAGALDDLREDVYYNKHNEVFDESMLEAEELAELDDEVEQIRDILVQWVKFGELVQIEFDTDNKTARVIKN